MFVLNVGNFLLSFFLPVLHYLKCQTAELRIRGFEKLLNAVVLKRFLFVYHLCVPYYHQVPPCYRKTQCGKYHSIKSLENQN